MDLALSSVADQEYEHDIETDALVFETLRDKGYLYRAPSFSDQVLDSTRDTEFKASIHCVDPECGSNYETKSEIEGLRELEMFLLVSMLNFQNRDLSNDDASRELYEKTVSIYNTLTFIGDPELSTGVTALGKYWQGFLDEDPRNRIFVVPGISNSEKYPDQVKSDQYLFDRIDNEFNLQDEYRDRFVHGLEGLDDADLEHTKLIYLDDWALSGNQISNAVFSDIDDPEKRKLLDNMEINFLVSNEDRVKNGMNIVRMSDYDGKRVEVTIPVFSVYLANSAMVDTVESSGVHITGLHSAANYGFSDIIDTLLRGQRKDPNIKFPALAGVESDYEDRT